MKSPFRLGLAVAVVVAVADWLSKYALLYVVNLPERQSIPILPFFDLTMVWNRGVSFGMMQTDGGYGRFALILFTGAIVVALLIWLWRCRRTLEAVALGGIIGGALGNIYDRLVYGAVADFFDFHLMGYHWYVFNLADAAISIGVGLLMLASVWPPASPGKADG